MRQVQARAVRQECAEGLEEVERGGRKEGWELLVAREPEGTDRSLLLLPPAISPPGEGSWWDRLGRNEPGHSQDS